MVLAETSNGQTIYYWHGLDLLAQSDGTTAQYFQYDGLGSVRQLAGAAGMVHYTDTFDPYGNLYASAGADGQTKYAFTGEQQDDNGLLFLRARYYSAESGHFFQTDPSRQEQNPYQYAMGNPATYTDPSGLMACASCEGGGGDGGSTGSQEFTRTWTIILKTCKGNLSGLLAAVTAVTTRPGLITFPKIALPALPAIGELPLISITLPVAGAVGYLKATHPESTTECAQAYAAMNNGGMSSAYMAFAINPEQGIACGEATQKEYGYPNNVSQISWQNKDDITKQSGYKDYKSRPTYGHSWDQHGSQEKGLADRAAARGQAQGQWKNNQDIVEAEQLTRDTAWQQHQAKPGGNSGGRIVTDYDMDRPVGREWQPDRTSIEDVTYVRVVRDDGGVVESSFPISKPDPQYQR